jgi:hypothetical protein
MELDINKLKEVVVQLHNAARSVTEEMGLNTLTLDIRECADRLNDLLKVKD